MAVNEPNRKSLFGHWGIYQTYSMREKKRKQEQDLEPFLRPIKAMATVGYCTVVSVVVLMGRSQPHTTQGVSATAAEQKASRNTDWNRFYILMGGTVAVGITANASERKMRRRILTRFAENPDTVTTSTA